ncbi:unnamed protein product [Dracunculus medinensis]|uniref:Reverse transcriptase domain-containing protein n=1 Tax=Dracunculus medinensis TaxID=318479 RepID=A0A158Q4L9_DRAME|nr:unnamed protein product [Dracunculus medinensis]
MLEDKSTNFKQSLEKFQIPSLDSKHGSDEVIVEKAINHEANKIQPIENSTIGNFDANTSSVITNYCVIALLDVSPKTHAADNLSTPTLQKNNVHTGNLDVLSEVSFANLEMIKAIPRTYQDLQISYPRPIPPTPSGILKICTPSFYGGNPNLMEYL